MSEIETGVPRADTETAEELAEQILTSEALKKALVFRIPQTKTHCILLADTLYELRVEDSRILFDSWTLKNGELFPKGKSTITVQEPDPNSLLTNLAIENPTELIAECLQIKVNT